MQDDSPQGSMYLSGPGEEAELNLGGSSEHPFVKELFPED